MIPNLTDNSFFLEEAFNQTIDTVQFSQDYNSLNNEFTATGEIPLKSEEHQFSYTVGQGRAINPTLSYRYQSVNVPNALLAHRFGVVVPIEDERYGFEYKQALTLILNDKWMNHWNLGLFHYPRFKHRTYNSYNAGTSFVYYAKENLNLVFESYLESDENYETGLIINPGLRAALNLEWQETQIVPGISFPISFNQETINAGVFLYLSIEPKF